MAADHADSKGIPLASISEEAKARLRRFLPPFASLQNPIDITGALLSNSKLFGQVLPVVGDDAQSEPRSSACRWLAPVTTSPGFARDLADFQSRYPPRRRRRGNAALRRVPSLRKPASPRLRGKAKRWMPSINWPATRLS